MTAPRIGYSDLVTEWCLGENDKFGDCFLVMAANLHVIVTTVNGAPEVMSDGEIETAYHTWKGFNPFDEKTDVGMSVEEMIKDWMRDGWPGDPTLKPFYYSKLNPGLVTPAIVQYGAVCAWCMLPMRDDEPDLSDGALALKIKGTVPHAVLIVDAEPGFLYLATWGERRKVSLEWWDTYRGEEFAVLLPAWRKPNR